MEKELRKKGFPFNLDTKEKREKHLKFLKLFFFIPLIVLMVGVIFCLAIRDSFSLYLVLISYLGLLIFLLYFFMENLLVMLKTKHYIFFVLSLFFGPFSWLFYFTYYHPFLKGKITAKIMIEL